ncbi:MAG TPA: NUDIX domain-containing protein [Dermatophilaceae bacterium]|nr:NUDIX domain-containing protein [Dermatophilaceae bacterium]
MPIPDFVARLRERIGHDLLPMVGVTGVVQDDTGRVLLGQRADTGRWALPSGILEPGEQPAPALEREILEETRVHARVDALIAVWAQPPMTYPNGHQAQYLDLLFACRYVAGQAAVGDDESLAVGWFDPAGLPAGTNERSRANLARALAFQGPTWFDRGPEPGTGLPPD